MKIMGVIVEAYGGAVVKWGGAWGGAAVKCGWKLRRT